jgi:1,4-dihydroxy-2-naphthoate octaprenyltransferase
VDILARNGFKSVALWIQASRALYTITVLLPCCLGAVVAWWSGYPFNWGLLVLILVGMMFANIGTNFTNDYFDYRSGVDKLDEGRVYKKGAEVLYDNPLAESGSVDGYALYFFSLRTILISALASLAVTTAIGLFFVLRVDWRILPIGLVGVLMGYFYTAPPVKFGYRGWGDLICFLGSGPFPVIGTFFLFSGRVTWTAVLAGIVAGLWVDAILYIGNVPDAEADRAVGKRTLSTILGRRAVRTLAPLYYGASFGLVAVGVVLGLFPLWALLCLLTLPIVVRVLVITRKHYDQIPQFAQAILMTVQVFAISTVLLGAGFILSRAVG